MTRIIAGAAKGRRLSVPPDVTRPTSDRVREALFSALDSALGAWAGVRVLDLYAGSGALGLEAASRGAAHVTLVERDRRALATLRANVDAVALPGVVVRAGDVVRVVAVPAPEPYDLVLADPPYDLEATEVEQVLARLVDGWLVPGARVVVERDRRRGFSWPTGYRPEPERRYGDTVLAAALWYRRDADSD